MVHRPVSVAGLVGLAGFLLVTADAGGDDQVVAPPVKRRLGPDKVTLEHDLAIDLPAGYVLFERSEAQALMEKMGNFGIDPELLAIIAKPPSGWFVVVRFDADGYVEDDDAGKLDPDEILKAIREGTEVANQERAKRGFPAMKVDGWTEPPRYEKTAHHLVWGIKGSDKGGASINYNTRVLGRKGYASLNLIDDPKNIEQSKPEVALLLKATTFAAGARYEDFQPKSDKVAEYGLAALVAGGAGAAALKLVKVGLLAKVLVFKKFIIIGLIALAGLVWWVLGRRKISGS